VLNRLFIVIGVVAILAITAAFVVPSFVPWGEYRDRLAAIAAEVVGQPVRIDGDVSFSLLPQPRLQFSGVSAGPADAPSLTVEKVEADFSLIDFLRDRYNVTRLVLDRPTVNVTVTPAGAIDAGLTLGGGASGKFSVANAFISHGAVLLSDQRTGETYGASNVEGELRLDALHGPYSFQGVGDVDGSSYALRLTTGELDSEGGGTLSLTVRPTDDRFALTAEGMLTSGTAPSFEGNVTWRQPPPKPTGDVAVDAGQGDLVMTSKVRATPARILLSDYVVIPDENRAATRLLGAADVTLGQGMAFNAVISGGLLALPPRDATAEQAVEPYELLRLLRELPLPASVGLPGTIGVDIAELNLRAFSLRNVRLDATAHDGGWTVKRFTGGLPGDSTVALSGEIALATGRPEFAGRLVLQSGRLDALATLWRKPADGNPLFGMPGAITADLNLVGETLSISNASLDLDGTSLPFSAQIGLGTNRDLHVAASLGQLDPNRSAALLALLPDLSADPAFAVSFPKGEFELSADGMTLGGLAGRDLAASGSWDGGVLVVDNVAAGDLGGARFSATLTAFGSLLKPELSGSGSVTVLSRDAPALAAFFTGINASPAMAETLSGSVPATLNLRLDAPNGVGAQSLDVTGSLGVADITADAALDAGFIRALSGPIRLKLDLKAAHADALIAQLGLGNAAIFSEAQPVHIVGVLDGNIANSLETTVLAEGGGDTLGFSGNIVVTNPDAYSGKGTLKATLTDPSGLAEWLGVGGIALPAISGTATIGFDGMSTLALDKIEGTAGGAPFTGRLGLAGKGGTHVVNGKLELGGLDIADLLRTVAGPASLLPSPSGLWPEGPFATGGVPRNTTGRVSITAQSLNAVGRGVASDLSLDLDWDATSTRLRNLTARVGEGTASLELAICCAGPLPDKQVSGRLSLTGIDLDSLAPPLVADALGGVLEASGRFDATGGSVAAILSGMTGEGTYSVGDFSIQRLDPGAATAVTGLDNILDLQPEELTTLIEDKLDDAAFVSPGVAGSFTIAGGVLRSPNLSINAVGGQLFGSGSIRLADLGLAGTYTLSPTNVAPAALVDLGAARVTTTLGGTLLAPVRRFDVSGLVDAIMVKAYEAEVARLEKLRAEDEARRKAEEEEKARIAAEEEAARRKAAEEAAKKAAEEAAAKQAAEDAAAQEEALKKALEEFNNRPVDIGLGN